MRFRALALRKTILQGGEYADHADSWNGDVLKITKVELQTEIKKINQVFLINLQPKHKSVLKNLRFELQLN